MSVSQLKDARLIGCFCRFTFAGFLRALNGFTAACDIAGMKISSFKTEVLHLSSNPVQCSPQVGDVLLKQVEKFKYLGVAFTSD